MDRIYFNLADFFGPSEELATLHLMSANYEMSSFYKSEVLGFLLAIAVYLSIGSCITAVSTYQFSLFF